MLERRLPSIAGQSCQSRLTPHFEGVRLRSSVDDPPLFPLARESKLKPRWDVHLSGDDDQLGYAGESLSSVLGE